MENYIHWHPITLVEFNKRTHAMGDSGLKKFLSNLSNFESCDKTIMQKKSVHKLVFRIINFFL
jgi:hypothetical protein